LGIFVNSSENQTPGVLSKWKNQSHMDSIKIKLQNTFICGCNYDKRSTILVRNREIDKAEIKFCEPDEAFDLNGTKLMTFTAQ
jgi:hypothetical protein